MRFWKRKKREQDLERELLAHLGSYYAPYSEPGRRRPWDVDELIAAVGLTEHGALPTNARRYLERIEALVGVPLDLISTGADRDETIVLRHPFDS